MVRLPFGKRVVESIIMALLYKFRSHIDMIASVANQQVKVLAWDAYTEVVNIGR
jgi:hypothetical protein